MIRLPIGVALQIRKNENVTNHCGYVSYELDKIPGGLGPYRISSRYCIVIRYCGASVMSRLAAKNDAASTSPSARSLPVPSNVEQEGKGFLRNGSSSRTKLLLELATQHHCSERMYFAMLRRSVRLFLPSVCGWHDVILGAGVPRTLPYFVIAYSSNSAQLQSNQVIRQLEAFEVHVLPLRRDLLRKEEWAPGRSMMYLILTPSVTRETRQTVFSLHRT
jgi:hypothetical protein